jgi:hypothetical protein
MTLFHVGPSLNVLRFSAPQSFFVREIFLYVQPNVNTKMFAPPLHSYDSG